MRARVAAWVGLVAIAAALASCNAILGVEDVTLRRDAGGFDAADDPNVDDDVFVPPEDTGTDAGPKSNPFQVALGALHTCAKKPDGTMRCWGDDDQGQIGTGIGFVEGGTRAPVLAPSPVVNMSDVVSIGAGYLHSCAVHADGSVQCWGYNYFGQLGNGQDLSKTAAPVTVLGLSDAVAVAGGTSFTCAVRKSGAAACWGINFAGQLGNDSTTDAHAPAAVSGLVDAVAIAAGQSHACAVRSGGTVMCWGDNFNGQLGTGNTTASLVPVAVPSLVDVVSVAAGARFTCAMQRSGMVYCWGANDLGQLGSGVANYTPNPSPIVVSGLSDARALGAGYDHACALRANGQVSCWGSGYNGELGNGVTIDDASTPTPSPVSVSGLTGATSVATGGEHSCATTATGFIFCWGQNIQGGLGDGTQNQAYTPVSVTGYP